MNVKFVDPEENPEDFAIIRRQFRNDNDDMTLAQKVSVNALKKNILKFNED